MVEEKEKIGAPGENLIGRRTKTNRQRNESVTALNTTDLVPRVHSREEERGPENEVVFITAPALHCVVWNPWEKKGFSYHCLYFALNNKVSNLR